MGVDGSRFYREAMRHNRYLAPASAIVALAILISGCHAPEPEPGQTLPSSLTARTPLPANQPYGSHASQHVDIYRPPAGFTGPRPMIVYVHGGAWALPDNSQVIGCTTRPDCVPALAQQIDRGFVVASIEYRLSPGGFTFHDMVADVKLAIKWLRQNATTYSIDPNKVVIAGHSAGGHLAALAALTPGQFEPPGVTGTHVNGFVALNSPIDIGEWAAWGDPASHPAWIRDLTNNMLGCTYSAPACASTVAAATPTTWVDDQDPPGYLTCKDTDPFVPCSHPLELHDALVAAHNDDNAAVYDKIKCTDPQRLVPCNDTTDNHRHNPDWDLNLAALELFLDLVTD